MNKFWKTVMILGIAAGFIFIVLPILAFIVFIFIAKPLRFKGDSMLPNYKNNQYWMTSKIAYKFSKPQRGDVVVFKAPPDNIDEFAKRVIGLPGETFKIKSGKVYINGNKLSEPYLSNSLTMAGSFIKEGDEVKIPENNYILLGDYREHSFDSRHFGFLPAQNIVGSFWFCYSSCN